MSTEPRFLVQTADDVLHAYWDLTILRIDLRANGDEGIRVYQRTNERGAIRYRPITVEALKEMAA